MVVTILLQDGSEQTLNAAELRLTLDGSPLELSFETSPTRLTLYYPSTDQHWQHFVVHHRCANVMSLEVVAAEHRDESAGG